MESLYLDETGVRLYDIAYGWKRAAEADFFEKCQAVYGRAKQGAVLDVGCGTGTFLQEMSSRGWQVAGVDSSEPMLSLAARRGCDTTGLLRADMVDFELDRAFDAACCWLDSFTYLLANDDIIRHLRCVANALTPGGLYLLDFGFDSWAQPWWGNPDPDWKPSFEDGWSSSSDDTEVYHDGCDGPPCDCGAHVFTEYMYFRATHKASKKEQEYCYRAPKRSLHPQEFAALVSASGVFEVVEIFTGQFDLGKKFDGANGQGRALALLRKIG